MMGLAEWSTCSTDLRVLMLGSWVDYSRSGVYKVNKGYNIYYIQSRYGYKRSNTVQSTTIVVSIVVLAWEKGFAGDGVGDHVELIFFKQFRLGANIEDKPRWHRWILALKYQSVMGDLQFQTSYKLLEGVIQVYRNQPFLYINQELAMQHV